MEGIGNCKKESSPASELMNAIAKLKRKIDEACESASAMNCSLLGSDLGQNPSNVPTANEVNTNCGILGEGLSLIMDCSERVEFIRLNIDKHV